MTETAATNGDSYDNYGNRRTKYYVMHPGIDSVMNDYTWTRGSCLESIRYADGTTAASYSYDRNGVRFQKTTQKLRYYYDADGVCGFRYYNGNEWRNYTYVKDTAGSVRVIKDFMGLAFVRY